MITMKFDRVLKLRYFHNLKKLLFSFLLIFIFSFAIASYSREFIKVFLPNGVSITAELAVTDEERQQGLMYREKIDSDQGMLFVFEEEDKYSFWMKNMKFSIDILWLDRDKKIVHIERKVPPCKSLPCPTYSPLIPSMYVLELKAGSADENHLKLYDKLEFILPQKNR
jgi:uncharacterized membrane protein (UPF0127 family)